MKHKFIIISLMVVLPCLLIILKSPVAFMEQPATPTPSGTPIPSATPTPEALIPNGLVGTGTTINTLPTSEQMDNLADLGNPEDEQYHNLVGWGSINPGLLSGAEDPTSRYQLLRGLNSLELLLPLANLDYTLLTRTEDGNCDDSFEIYINDQGPIFTYYATPEYIFPFHTVKVGASYITSTQVKVTFKNIAQDSCGLAAVYFVKMSLPDSDGDGIPNIYDNCPTIYNPDQNIAACIDTDGDSIFDLIDNCPKNYNPDQKDTDQNGIGDACNQAEDQDNDEIADYLDNCPKTFNPDQFDSDTAGPIPNIAYWKFDEGSGTIAKDSIGQNDGTLYGPIWTEGRVGSALSLDGIDDYVITDSLMSSPNIETLELWIYPKSSGVIVSELGQQAINTGYHYIKIGLNTNNELKGNFWDCNEDLSFGIINLNQWYHVVLVYDGSTERAYLNGEFKDSYTHSRYAPSTQYLAFSATDSQTAGGFNNTNYFNGLIDEVAIFNRALTPSEIQRHFQSGLKGLGYYGGDGIGDACDNCPLVYNPDQKDTDNDGIGDVCEPANQPPIIFKIDQYKSDGITPIPETATTTENIVVFKATLTDPDNDQVKLQVELRQKDEEFTGQDDGGILTSDFVNSGSEATKTRPVLSDGQYHWRYRAIDDKGNASSDWQNAPEFGIQGNVDFVVKIVPLYTQVRSPYPSDIDTRRWSILPYANTLLWNYQSFPTIFDLSATVSHNLQFSFHASYKSTTDPTTPKTLGKADIGSKTKNKLSSYVNANKIILSESGIFESLGIYIENPAGNIRLAIYDDLSNKPNKLKVQTGDSVAVQGWNTLSISKTTLLPGTYWLLFQTTSDELTLRYDFVENIGFRSGYSCGLTIAQCGCAITSGVMILRYYDGDDLIQNEDINPQTLNEWLKNHQGYYSNGDVNWLKIAEYSGNQIKYDEKESGNYKIVNYSLLDNYLEMAKPTIGYAKAKGYIKHFIVIDNKLEIASPVFAYNVKDPHWYNTERLDELATNEPQKIMDYNNIFSGLRLFSLSDGKPRAAISLNLASPAELLITDPLGRKLGKDPLAGIEYTEIPEGNYFTENIDDPTEELPPSEPESKVAYIGNPIDGQYDIEVIGTDSGSYTVGLLAYDNQGQTQSKILAGNTDVNVLAVYDINYNSQQAENITFVPRDIEAPIISHTPLNLEYILNSAPVAFEFSAQDTGVGVFSVKATLDGNPISSGQVIVFDKVGTHIIEITAIDFLSNTATKVINFNVVYQFSGFLPPIKSEGIYNRGRTLPTKLQLTDANNNFISTATARLFVANIQDGVVGKDEIPSSTSAADKENYFRYDSKANQYIYNLSTDKLSIGSWQLKVILDDGKYYIVIILIR